MYDWDGTGQAGKQSSKGRLKTRPGNLVDVTPYFWKLWEGKVSQLVSQLVRLLRLLRLYQVTRGMTITTWYLKEETKIVIYKICVRSALCATDFT